MFPFMCRHLYYSESRPEFVGPNIFQSSLDGSDVVGMICVDGFELNSLSVDIVHNVLYWTYDDHTLQSYPLDRFTGSMVYAVSVESNIHMH